MKYPLLFLVLWSSSLSAIELEGLGCSSRSDFKDTVLSLEVSAWNRSKVIFQLCNLNEEKLLSLTKVYFEFEEDGTTSTKDIVLEDIHLSKLEYDKIHSLFKVAYKYDALDSGAGRHGSTWCIKSRKEFTHTEACFWTPSNAPKKRNLDGMYNLGTFLWSFSNLDKDKKLGFY